MTQPLSKKEVHELMSLLNFDQREFLDAYSKQNKKSKWIEALARSKGIVIKEDMSYEEIETLIDDWVLIDVMDSGYGNRDYRCECGMPLRYQYKVLHKKEQKTYGYGETCFENHTNLSVSVIKDIKNGFHTVDLERDEILVKYRDKNYWNLKPFLYVETIPFEILEQDRLKLPLTNHQKARVLRLKEKYDADSRKEKVISRFSEEQKDLFYSLKLKEQNEIIEKYIRDEIDLTEIPEGFKNTEIERFLSVGLSLLDRQMEEIIEYNWKLKRKFAMTNPSEANRRERNPVPQTSVKYAAVDTKPKRIEEKIDFQKLSDRHLETLKQVRSKEDNLSEGMKRDWDRIQDMVRTAKSGGEIDYSSFKLNLTMICYALQIKLDEFL
jgi:hypothetical protein